MEFFRQAGIHGDVEAVAVRAAATLGKISAPTLATADLPDTPPAVPNTPNLTASELSPGVLRGTCPQDRLDAVVLSAARERGATIAYSTTLVSAHQDDSCVTAVLYGPDGRQTVRASYLVDGGRSEVRAGRCCGPKIPACTGNRGRRRPPLAPRRAWSTPRSSTSASATPRRRCSARRPLCRPRRTSSWTEHPVPACRTRGWATTCPLWTWSAGGSRCSPARPAGRGSRRRRGSTSMPTSSRTKPGFAPPGSPRAARPGAAGPLRRLAEHRAVRRPRQCRGADPGPLSTAAEPGGSRPARPRIRQLQPEVAPQPSQA